MVTQEWSDVLLTSLQSLWLGVADFLPRLILAVIVFIIGWIIAITLGRLTGQIIGFFKIDKVLQKTGIEEPLARGGLRLNSGAFVGGLVKWFFLIAFLVASIDILGLNQVNVFLRDTVLLYLPNVIVAVLILMAAAFLADVLQRVVVSSAKAARVTSASFLGGMVKWAIWIFAILAALYQLGIAGPFVQTLFTGFIAMLAIAGGLAFGLGGKESASKLLGKLRRDFSEE
jgi:small-conductance mechanosensitive channel